MLDGVSSVVPYLSDKKETGGYLAAQAVKDYFESLDQVGQLAEHAAAANDKLRELMEQAQVDMEKKTDSGERLWLLCEFKRSAWNSCRPVTA